MKIGSYSFQLDESIDHNANVVGGSLFRPHYKHTKQQLFEDRAPLIVGAPDSAQVRPERLIWSFSDWIGGENNRTYQPKDPDVYNYALGVNPRIRGEITGRPNRVVSLLTGGLVSQVFTAAAGKLWAIGGGYLNSSSDGVTWGGVALGYTTTAATGTARTVYWARQFGAAVTSVYQDDGSIVVIAQNGHTTVDHKGIAHGNGHLYAWDGSVLWEYDVYDHTAYPLSYNSTPGYRKVGTTDDTPSGAFYANCVTAETSIFMFTSSQGISNVYEFQLDGGFSAIPVWVAPSGFIIRGMCYNNGILYFSGNYGNASAGRGALYAMPLDTRRPMFVDWVRTQNNVALNLEICKPSYGSQILLGDSITGRIWVYDADTDGLSMLDDPATSGSSSGGDGTEGAPPRMTTTDTLTFVEGSDSLYDVATFGPYRVAVTSKGGANYAYVSYSDDEPANVQASTSTGNAVSKLYTGSYDFGMPFDQKALLAFEVMFAPLTTGQSFQIDYSLDGAAYVAGTAVDWTNADAAKGQTVVPVSTGSSTVNFARMSWRITLTGARTAGVNYAPPIIYNVTTEAVLLNYDETFDLLLRLKNEHPRSRRRGSQVNARKIRQDLFTAVGNHQLMTFLDGYVSGKPGEYDTYTVVIDHVEDVVVRETGEGTCHVRLRVPVYLA